MSPVTSSQPAPAQPSANIAATRGLDIDASCRVPLLLLFLSAAAWFLVGAGCALLASIKFHSPNFLADTAWLTYGRLQPAGVDAMLYGGCVQAGLGVGLWLLARLGRTPLTQWLPVTVGAGFWNLGLTIAFVGILVGDSTGFARLELPAYSVLIIFLGYLLIGICGVSLFHQRRNDPAFVSQWYLFTALYWFPWIYSTAELLLVGFPVRGVTQAVIAWWYADNLQVVWLGLVGLAAIFYFVPKLSGRELHSHYLALFAYWTLVLFGGWSGVPRTAPVPAWMPTISTVSRVLMVLPLLAVALNVWRTLRSADASSAPSENQQHANEASALRFIVFGVVAFVVAGFMRAFGALFDTTQELQFTWFVTARAQLHLYGFFAMVMFGAVYYILPQITGTAFPSTRLIRAHFWLAAAGIVLLVLPLAIGGVVETFQLQNSNVPFINIVKASLGFLRASTVGDLLILLGQLVFLVNLGALAARFSRVQATTAYTTATMDLFKPAEAKS